MKNTLLIIIIFLYSSTLFSQEIKFDDIFNLYPVLIDRGSIKEIDGKIFLKAHKTDDRKLLVNSMAIFPDTAYERQVQDLFMEKFHEKIASAHKKILFDIEDRFNTFISRQEDPEKLEQDSVNNFLFNLMQPVIYEEFKDDFFNNELSIYFSEIISDIFIKLLSNPNMDFNKLFDYRQITYHIIIDCKEKTIIMDKMDIVMYDNSMRSIKMSNEKKIDDIDSRGSNYRIFYKICNKEY